MAGQMQVMVRQWLYAVRGVVSKEGPVLFVYVAMTAGTLTSVLIFGQVTNVDVAVLVGVAIVSSILGLPKVFARLRGRQEPYVLLFARAFGAGFRIVRTLLPDFFRWVKQVRMFQDFFKSVVG